jgi:hypothetical protein
VGELLRRYSKSEFHCRESEPNPGTAFPSGPHLGAVRSDKQIPLRIAHGTCQYFLVYVPPFLQQIRKDIIMVSANDIFSSQLIYSIFFIKFE